MGNANQDNLWEQLTMQGHYDRTLSQDLSIKKIMDSWTLKKGYPVVSIERKINQNNSTLTLNVKQDYFLLNSMSKLKSSSLFSQIKWFVPFTFTTKSDANFDFESRPHWLKPDEYSYEINVFGGDGDVNLNWVVGNILFSGFYRVNYDAQNWNLLIEQLKSNHKQIHVVNRAQLIDDGFNLAKGEYIENTIYLNILSYLVSETDSLPFKAAKDGLEFYEEMFYSNYTIHNWFKV